MRLKTQDIIPGEVSVDLSIPGMPELLGFISFLLSFPPPTLVVQGIELRTSHILSFTHKLHPPIFHFNTSIYKVVIKTTCTFKPNVY
jgi:hypothetical protein